MKKLLLFFIFPLFVSCNSDDPENVNQPINIVGFWEEKQVKEEGESEFTDVSNCETHPQSNTYEFTDFNALQISYTCHPEMSNHTLGAYYVDGDILVSNPFNVEDVDDYTEKHSITVIDEQNIKLKEVWNTIDGDVVNGREIVVRKRI